MFLSARSNSVGRPRGVEYAKTLAQLVALAYGLHGIDLVYGPAAYIIGAVVIIVALEFQ